MSEGRTAWYVYAVIDAAEAGAVGPLAGIDDVPVQVVASSGLAAVAAPVDLAGFRAAQDEPSLREDGWLAAAVRAHDRVVEGVFDVAPVLPFRFGALYPDRAGVVNALASRCAQLREGLRRIAGTAEWSVKVAGTEAATDQEPTEPDTVDGTSWMLRRRDAVRAREAARDRWARVATEVCDGLGQYARETYLAPRSPRDPTPTIRAVCLVGRVDEEAFVEAVRDLVDGRPDDGLRWEVSGPRPAYHYAAGADRG